MSSFLSNDFFWNLRRLRQLLTMALLGGLIWAAIPDNPARVMSDQRVAPIWIVNHGLHASLVLRRAELQEPRLLAAFPQARWFSIYWGDAAFFQHRSIPAMLRPDRAIAAMFTPTPSALHVWGLDRPPQFVFDPNLIRQFEIDLGGVAALNDHIAKTLPAEFQSLGEGLQKGSLVFLANGDYHIMSTSNHWLSNAMNAAGFPTTSFWGSLPVGMLSEIDRRTNAAGQPVETPQ